MAQNVWMKNNQQRQPRGVSRSDGQPCSIKEGDSWGLHTVVMLNIILTVSAGLLFANTEHIRLNQLGFSVHGPKMAIAISPATWYFSLRSPDLATIYLTKELSVQTTWNSSGETLKVADFSEFTGSGNFVVYIEGIGASYGFRIADDVYHEVTKGLLRGFYYQRSSTNLPSTFAGQWARAAGHDDRNVIIHASAASDPTKPGGRKTDQMYPSPKGWYDAGDYGKYVVNAGITTYQLLLLYDLFPQYFGTFELTIPESDNTLPDILDEIKWELDWLLTMQDPADGGIYHKVTGKTFIGDLMPAAANETRYFIGKGSAATFDFVAVLSMASRIYQPFLPSFADSCLAAAKYAWEWGVAHPDSAFMNPPDIVTGEYGDGKTGDEFLWAADELFITTGDSSYFLAGQGASKDASIPSWPNVAMLGYYSLACIKNDSLATYKVVHAAEQLVNRVRTHPYRTSISNEFYWGSNGVVANQGMAMLVAYILTKDFTFLEGAIHAADYLFGRNATGYCFVTGYGSKTPMRPHHRPSTADNIKLPVPGFLVGGPNASSSRNGEGCDQEYPKKSAKAYLDNNCSFTTNEVAINWNAPGAFLAGGIDAILNSGMFDLRNFGKKDTDLQSPDKPYISITDITADHATVSWISTEPTSATIACAYSSDMEKAWRYYGASNDSGGTTLLTGLHPDTLYYIKVLLVDRSGNCSAATDSFRTTGSECYIADLYHNVPAMYHPGTSPQITFPIPDGITAQLVYSIGGSEIVDTLPFMVTALSATATLPSTATGQNGIIYSILLTKGTASLHSPIRSLIPDSLFLTNDSMAVAATYQMVSLPGHYQVKPSKELFEGIFGDTAQWRFFGYDPHTQHYIPFDSLKSGNGGWLYHKKNSGFSCWVKTVAPDTLFPIVVHEGWNCIGIPYTFPIFWDNCMVDHDGALVQLTDSAAQRFVRRQFFHYRDTLPDKQNNGFYITNRQLASHVYNDSASLKPWEAYWVYAEKDNVTCLLNPTSKRPTPPMAKRMNRAPRSWTVLCTIQSGCVHEAPIAFGCSELAQNGYDQCDSPKPPSLTPLLQAGFRHADWPTRSKVFTEDIASFTESGTYHWPLEITAAPPDTPLLLQWEINGEVNGKLYLRDELTGTVIDMYRQNKATLAPAASRTITFILLQDKMPMVYSEPAFRLTVRYDRGICFVYAVPLFHDVTRPVHIDIFDVQGRKIATPLSGRVPAGTYTLRWDPHAGQGDALADGYYIARISDGIHAVNTGFQVVR